MTRVRLGGQAVIEGVMMRNSESMVISYRSPDGEIGVYREKLLTLSQRHRFFGLPLIRGAAVFWEAFVTGIRALNISAERTLEGEREKPHPVFMLMRGIFGISLGLAFFLLFPTFSVQFLPPLHPVWLNLLEGLLRVLLFIIYLLSIGFNPGGYLTMPGLWLQGLTTREPDRPQLEVALTALNSLLQFNPKAAPGPDKAAVGS